MKTIGVGFIGAGGNARGHMKRVQDMEGTQIVAACDIVAERAEAAVKEYGGRAYTDHHEMLEKEDMDALYISVPPFAHTDAEIIAAEKGLHLFIEKPVALTMEKGLEIHEAIEKSGVISCVGYQLRYAVSADRAKAFLADKTIAMVVSHRWGGLPSTPWWKVMAQSGGQLVEQTTHQVDMIRYLAGEIVEVSAIYALRTLTDVEGLDIPDVGAVLFQLGGGGIGALTTSCALTKGGGKGDLDIILKDGVLRWSYGSISAVPGEYPELTRELGPPPSIDAIFIEAIQTGSPSRIRSPYLDALKTLDVTLAANQSAKEGRPVRPYFAS